jgi:hypothetical protein
MPYRASVKPQMLDAFPRKRRPPASAGVMIDTSAPVISIASPQTRDYVHSDRVAASLIADAQYVLGTL